MDDASITRRRQRVRDSMLQTPYVHALGLIVEKFEPDGVVLTLPFSEWLTNDGIHLHGGVISAVLDTAGAAAVWAAHDFAEPMQASTIGLNVQFAAACKGADLRCTARVVRRVRGLVFTEATGFDPNAQVIAHSTQTYRLRSRGHSSPKDPAHDDGTTT